ncbi:hypothetical protein MTR67_045107, partial [Solanum verrucosum]
QEGNLRLGIKWSFEARDHVQSTLEYRLSSFSCCWFSIAYELYNNETFVKCFFVESGAVIGFCLNFCGIFNSLTLYLKRDWNFSLYPLKS